MKLVTKFIAFIFAAALILPSPTVGLAPTSGLKSENLTAQEILKLQPLFPSARSFFEEVDSWLATHPHHKIVVLARHGESTSNVLQYAQSPFTFSPLTTLGLKQASGMAEFISSQGIDFDRFLSSDLERTRDTLQMLTLPSGKIPETSKLIRETVFWPIGGILAVVAALAFPDSYEAFVRNPEEFEIPGIFSGIKFKRGLETFYGRILNSDDRKIFVVTHGVVILLSIMTLLKIDFHKYKKVYKKIGNSPHVGITILAFDSERMEWKLLVYGDDSYLEKSLRGKTAGFPNNIKEVFRYYCIAVRRALFKTHFLKEGGAANDFFPTRESFLLAPTSKGRIKKIIDQSILHLAEPSPEYFGSYL